MSLATTVTECCRCCLIKEDDMVYVFDILDEFDSKICDLIESCGDVTVRFRFSRYIKHRHPTHHIPFIDHRG